MKNLQHPASSESSWQSLTPSQRQLPVMQFPSRHRNSRCEHCIDGQLCSSELSPQSLSPSQRQAFGTHRPEAQEKCWIGQVRLSRSFKEKKKVHCSIYHAKCSKRMEIWNPKLVPGPLSTRLAGLGSLELANDSDEMDDWKYMQLSNNSPSTLTTVQLVRTITTIIEPITSPAT